MAQNFLAIEPADKCNSGITPLNPHDGEVDGKLIAGKRASRALGWKMVAFDESAVLGEIANLYLPAASSEFDRGSEKYRGTAGAPIGVALLLLSVRKLFVVA
jgi:hypothetical protein